MSLITDKIAERMLNYFGEYTDQDVEELYVIVQLRFYTIRIFSQVATSVARGKTSVV